MRPDEKSKNTNAGGQTRHSPLAGQGGNNVDPGGDRQTRERGPGRWMAPSAQQSEESQTDGLVKETSPHEGTGPRRRGTQADSLLVRAARGLRRLTQKH